MLNCVQNAEMTLARVVNVSVEKVDKSLIIWRVHLFLLHVNQSSYNKSLTLYAN